MIAPLRRLTSHRAILPLTARAICARLVRESPRFFARELLRPAGIRTYHLRESGLVVAIRHRGAPDASTLAEVFYHRFYDPPADVAQVIGEPSAILDLGANIGLFGVLASTRWPSAEIVGYEPDPANALVHERTIAENALGSRWTLVTEAAGAQDGEIRFVAGLGTSSHVFDARNPEAGTIVVAQRDVLGAIAGADLVKIDIEGGEWEILCDARFVTAPPRALVLEYHPEGCPESDPRAAAERILASAGLLTAPIGQVDNGVGMLWAWQP